MSIDPTTPTIAGVAALIRARTKDKNGNEVGVFTADTRPSDVQCQEAIDHAVTALQEKVGVIGADCADVAQLAATYGAAAEIELSYFPEQSRTDRSPYTYLLNRYEQLLDGVQACLLGNLPSSGQTDGGSPRLGTVEAMSGTVHDYYRGWTWPVVPAPPTVTPLSGGDE